MLWALTLAAWIAVCCAQSPADSDSLQGALEAIDRRQRDLSDSTLYYLDNFNPPQEIIYPLNPEGDGQPEDIGYGYQKTFAPKTAGIFEAIPLPQSELGSHDPGVESQSAKDKALQEMVLAFLEHSSGNSKAGENHRYDYQTQNPAMKRSVFRERDVNELPGALQNLYSEGEHSSQFFENGERPQEIPSSFRERFSSKSSRNNPVSNAHALVRNFGGLNRDSDHSPEDDEDPDEYLSMLNSIWEKYQHGNPEVSDPEDLTEGDVEEIVDYINRKEEKKRQYDNSYETGYDFFNSPLAWVKRSRPGFTNNPSHSGDNLRALKLLNNHHKNLDRMQEDIFDDGKDDERLLAVQQALDNYRKHSKRFWRGNSFDDHHKHSKRYPITKRSSNFYANPAFLYHKASPDRFNQRRKKNVKSVPLDSVTDPKVAKDLNDIFSPSHDSTKNKSIISKNMQDFTTASGNETNDTKNMNGSTSQSPLQNDLHNHDITSHPHTLDKRSGQKEESGVDSQHKPLSITKKSVDWSNYFGIDRRRKKAMAAPVNDEWLLDQYLKAYLISSPAAQPEPRVSGETDDMDSKLQAMEDMIVDQALKYTGAHEGVTDPDQLDDVTNRVMSQLLAAFSLEKMREALREFKSSLAVEKAAALTYTTTNAPTGAPEQKDKRVAIKKEKAEIAPDMKPDKKQDLDNAISVLHSDPNYQPNAISVLHSDPQYQPNKPQEQSCPVMEQVTQRCEEIAVIAGDISTDLLLPLCTLHQICYLCGSEMGTTHSGCDATFLSQANAACGQSLRCRNTVRRTMAAMHSLRGDPSPLGCDWQAQPCLASYLSMVR